MIDKSDFRRFLWLVPYYSLADPLHANAIDVLDEHQAAHLAAKVPGAGAGQVLISFRELGGGTMALLDVESERVIWAARGPWMSQHDTDVLPNGNILLFDNRGRFGPGGESRVIEVDPGDSRIAVDRKTGCLTFSGNRRFTTFTTFPGLRTSWNAVILNCFGNAQPPDWNGLHPKLNLARSNCPVPPLRHLFANLLARA